MRKWRSLRLLRCAQCVPALRQQRGRPTPPMGWRGIARLSCTVHTRRKIELASDRTKHGDSCSLGFTGGSLTEMPTYVHATERTRGVRIRTNAAAAASLRKLRTQSHGLALTPKVNQGHGFVSACDVSGGLAHRPHLRLHAVLGDRALEKVPVLQKGGHDENIKQPRLVK